MFARVSTYEGEAGQLRQGFESVTDQLEQVEGLEGAFFLINSESGKAISMTLWESREALDESADAARGMRDQATQPSGATIVSVENYEVAITLPR